MAQKRVIVGTIILSLCVIIFWMWFHENEGARSTFSSQKTPAAAPDSFPSPSSSPTLDSQRATQKPLPLQATPDNKDSPIGQQDEAELPVNATVTVKDGRLSVHAEKASLRWVLDEITRHSGILILSGGEVGEPVITMHFDNLEVEQGLRRLLYNWDVFAFYGTTNVLRSMWFYPPGKGENILPAPIEAWGSTHDLEGMLTASDPVQRLGALRTLAERNPQAASKAVMDALADRDGEVRRTALTAALMHSIAVPADTLVHLVYNDTSATVRHDALAALSGMIANYSLDAPVDIAPIAQRASTDADANVQALADQILDRIAPHTESLSPGQVAGESRSQGTEE